MVCVGHAAVLHLYDFVVVHTNEGGLFLGLQMYLQKEILPCNLWT